MPWFGLHLNSFAYPGVPTASCSSAPRRVATAAEESGFDSIWVLDHLVQGGHAGLPHEPMPESYAMLSALAARTTRVTLGTLVTAVTFRNPAHLAKVVTTLDVISSGRAILGIGAAWYEPEHAGYGIPFPPTEERMDRLEETLQICKLMFTEERPSFEGRYYQDRPRRSTSPARCSRAVRRSSSAAPARSARCAWSPATPTSATSPSTPGRDVIPHKLDVLAPLLRRGGPRPSTRS